MQRYEKIENLFKADFKGILDSSENENGILYLPFFLVVWWIDVVNIFVVFDVIVEGIVVASGMVESVATDESSIGWSVEFVTGIGTFDV